MSLFSFRDWSSDELLDDFVALLMFVAVSVAGNIYNIIISPRNIGELRSALFEQHAIPPQYQVRVAVVLYELLLI